MAGAGAFTALDGERACMNQYDLILTPAWLWHDHGNETDQPMIWLDGLDIPLVQMLDASFAEWRETLEVLRRSEAPHAHDGYLMEFINPVDGGPVMATMSAFARLIPAGFATQPARQSDGMIHVVVEGSGTVTIDGTDFALTLGEIVVVPAWSERRIAATTDPVLFSYSDRATQDKLGLWREELG